MQQDYYGAEEDYTMNWDGLHNKEDDDCFFESPPLCLSTWKPRPSTIRISTTVVCPLPSPLPTVSNSPLSAMPIWSRSEGEIEAFSADKTKERRVNRHSLETTADKTSSTIAAPSSIMCSSSTPRHCLFRIHKKQMEKWQEEIREL